MCKLILTNQQYYVMYLRFPPHKHVYLCAQPTHGSFVQHPFLSGPGRRKFNPEVYFLTNHIDAYCTSHIFLLLNLIFGLKRNRGWKAGEFVICYDYDRCFYK